MALSAALGVPHVSTGQMFREATRRGGPLGEAARQFIDKGQLVPDEITIQVVQLWLDEHGQDSGFIFDGFPRTLTQAEAFDRVLQERGTPVTTAVLFELDEAAIVARVLGRLSCERCGALYHKTFVPPTAAGVCDVCGSKLVRRADDTEATVRKRLKVYRDLTMDVVAHYERAGVLRRLDAGKPKDEVFAAVLGIVQS